MLAVTRIAFGALALAFAFVASTNADAFVICAKRSKKTGVIVEGATLKLRTVCKSTETQVDPASVGLQSALAATATIRLGNQISTNGSLSSPANCAVGEVATGGGALTSGTSGGLPVMHSSRPQPDTEGAMPTGWRVTIANGADVGSITSTTYAVCVAP